MGQRRDAALREDALLSAYTMKNFDIVYAGETADLIIRKGYDRWNTNELDDPITQLYPFVDMSQNFNLLGVSGSRWRAISEAGAHVVLVNEAATAMRPIESFGDRVFYATDTDAYWSDNASIGGANPSYRLGIEKPTAAPVLAAAAAEGRINGAAPSNVAGAIPPFLELDAGSFQGVASKYTPGSDIDISTLYVMIANVDTISDGRLGGVRLTIRADSGGLPGAAISGDAQSDWIEVTAYDHNVQLYVPFDLYATVTLSSGVDYWFSLEANPTYLTSYDGTGPSLFYFCFGVFNDPPTAAKYNGAAWSGTTYAFAYMIDGLDPTLYYDYKYTYYNDTYKSESRPSPLSIRIIASNPVLNRVSIAFASTVDPQVDGTNVYRREIGTDGEVLEADITNFFLYVGSGTVLGLHTDGTPTIREGARLHSEDHYLYDETDDTDQGKRDAALMPAGFIEWKGRLWFWEENGNILYFSKVFERNNPNGLVGESSPDYFPLDNRQEFQVPSSIVNAKKLSNDQMAVYFKNEQIWIITGADSPLNPPADLAIRPTYQTIGLFATNAVLPYAGANLYLSREGLYRFVGIGGFAPELLSETQGGILDVIENQYFVNSLIRAYGREIWVLVDSDNDGDLDLILILDIERGFQTRQIVDRAWRSYELPVQLNDLAVVNVGDNFRQVLAAPITDGWILELNNGLTDNGAAIVGEVESHDILAPSNAQIFQLDLDGEYTDVDNMPTIDVTLTSHNGDTVAETLTPTSNEDIRGQRMGFRMKRPVSVRANLAMTSTKRDKIRGITMEYDGE